MEKFIVATPEGFKLKSNGKILEISTQIGDTWKSCTLKDSELKALRRNLKVGALPDKLKLVQSKLKKILQNDEWRPSKAMFDADFEQSKKIIELQQTLIYLYNAISEYE